jgi:hypothetical protein
MWWSISSNLFSAFISVRVHSLRIPLTVITLISTHFICFVCAYNSNSIFNHALRPLGRSLTLHINPITTIHNEINNSNKIRRYPVLNLAKSSAFKSRTLDQRRHKRYYCANEESDINAVRNDLYSKETEIQLMTFPSEIISSHSMVKYIRKWAKETVLSLGL